MKRTVDFWEFRRAFEQMGRGEQFSDKGLEALYDALAQLEIETGQEIELDVVGLCCEFAEYENIDEYNADYGTDHVDIDDVENDTWVIPIDGERFIIQVY